MTMKRLFIWLTLAMILVWVTGVAIFLIVTRDPISEANYNKIQIGMTKKEVVGILGPGIMAENASGLNVWEGKRKIILIAFDRDGLLVAKSIGESLDAPDNVINKLRRWLGQD